MSVTFTKLFSSITESTIWVEPHATRITWIAMLAMADRKGRVWASIPGLANRARVTLEECETAIACFLRPDKYSRTPDHDGRRIEPIDGGWQLLNYAKYRAIQDEESRREYKRDWDREKRPERGQNPTKASESDNGRHGTTQAEAEAEDSKKQDLKKPTPAARGTRLTAEWEPDGELRAWTKAEQPSWDGAHYAKVLASFRDYWASKPGKDGVKLDWSATWRNWVRKEGPKPAPRTSGQLTDGELMQRATILNVATKGLDRAQIIEKIRAAERAGRP